MLTRISYVIGAHNSESVIKDTLGAIAGRLAGIPSEIIIVENGSTDRTREVLADLRASWPEGPVQLVCLTAPKGLGHAIRTGVRASTGETVVLTADDLPFGFDELDAAEQVDIREKKVLIGSKAHPESAVDRSFFRTFISFGYLVVRRLAIGLKTGDPQGTYVLDGDWARRVEPALVEGGFLVTTELSYAAELAGIMPIEVPVRLRRASHATRISFADPFKMALGLVALRGRRKRLKAAAVTPDTAAPGGRASRSE
ncbi:glycosyltransferase [Longispora albida]|uniref:glycosyltransferase n=1 Tax=Longispora albida TaxID=203523 RepID=UPI00036F9B55|nr:glycosyltransferase [Longispora albida]